MECAHPYLESWGELGWHCKVCKAGIQDGSPLAAKAEAQKEEALRADEAAFGGDPDKSADASFRRGVPIAWLIQWTNARACWDMPTWQVCLHVMSETEGHGRCRYVEIEEHAKIAGAAQVFVSHAWGSRWGNLVQALGEILEGETRVWIDLFAVRQWPGNAADLDFTGVVKRCQSLVVVVPSLPALRGNDSFYTREALATLLPAEDRKQLAFLRYWCLVEIAEAVVQGLPVVCMGGTGCKGEPFKYDTNMLLLASQCIDVENAEATNPADKARLKSMLSDVPGGAAGVNRLARRVLLGAWQCSKARFCSSILSCTALGTNKYLLEKIDEHEGDDSAMLSLLCSAVAAGNVHATKCLLEKGIGPDFRTLQCGTDKSAMAFAAMSGSAGCMELLLQSGANVNQLHHGGLTPVVFAATRDNAEAVVWLFQNGADMMVTSHGTNMALLHAEDTKSNRAYCAVQILIEIQGMEKLVFNLDSTVRAPEFSPLVNNLHRLLKLTDEGDAMDAVTEMEIFHSELKRMVRVTKVLMSESDGTAMQPLVVRALSAGAAVDCFDARAGNGGSARGGRDDCIDEVYDLVAGKETETLTLNLMDFFETGKLPTARDLAQLSGELSGEEQEIITTLLFFATGALQNVLYMDDPDDEDSLLILAAGYQYRRLCRLLLALGIPHDVESLSIILEDEPEKFEFLRELIGETSGTEEKNNG